MKKMWNWIRNEHPTWAAYGISTLVTLGVFFTGWDISEEQKAAIVTVVLMIVGIATHEAVTPEAKAVEREVAAHESGVLSGATAAANEVAENLTDATAGVAGRVSQMGTVVVADAVSKVTGLLGGLLRKR